jgi:hypothetical protein
MGHPAWQDLPPDPDPAPRRLRHLKCPHEWEVFVMTIIWLIVWLVQGTPEVASWGPWNSWGIGLFVCLAIDLLGALGSNGRRSARPRGTA